MDGPGDDHNEVSKSERRERQIHSINYRWNPKYGINGLIYQTETDSQTERTDLHHLVSEVKQGEYLDQRTDLWVPRVGIR